MCACVGVPLVPKLRPGADVHLWALVFGHECAAIVDYGGSCVGVGEGKGGA